MIRRLMYAIFVFSFVFLSGCVCSPGALTGNASKVCEQMSKTTTNGLGNIVSMLQLLLIGFGIFAFMFQGLKVIVSTMSNQSVNLADTVKDFIAISILFVLGLISPNLINMVVKYLLK